MIETLTRARLEELLAAFKKIKIGVVGDFTLDAYWYADMTRSQLSRETPLFPRPVVRETYSPGGAANVAWNLADLGLAQVIAFTAFGLDWRGEILKDVLGKVGVLTTASLTVDGWYTPMYGKIELMNGSLVQEDARLDFVNQASLPPVSQTALLEKIRAAVTDLDGLVIADYQPLGIFSDEVRSGLNALAIQFPRCLWIADSRDQIGKYPAMILYRA